MDLEMKEDEREGRERGNRRCYTYVPITPHMYSLSIASILLRCAPLKE